MKHLTILGIAVALFVTGCSTPRTVANLEGKGTRQAFNYSYDTVWRAAVDAAQQGELEIIHADRERGYISARRGVQIETFGENVGIWVRSLGPANTQVEVVSRQSGPPVMWLKNWENEILRAVAANVTREAVGGVGSQSTTTIVPVPQERTTVVIPEPRDSTTVVVPAPRATVDVRRETELRLEELRRQQREHEEALAREESERRREEIRAEIDRLRAELRGQEQRLRELEREVK